jgi:hypothetical protein
MSKSDYRKGKCPGAPPPPNPNPTPTPTPNPNPNPKSKGDTTHLVNGMSSGFASGVVTKGKPMSLEEQKKKKACGIF